MEASVSTQELWARLFRAPSIDGFFAANEDAFAMPSFAEYITGLAESKRLKPEHVINSAGLEKSFGHRLFSGARNPSRDSALQLAFGFGLTADEAQQLLKIAHVAPLHPKVKRDAVIAYCLQRGDSLIDAQQTLYEVGLPLMGRQRA